MTASRVQFVGGQMLKDRESVVEDASFLGVFSDLGGSTTADSFSDIDECRSSYLLSHSIRDFRF
jgi:hypothetical protein